MSFKDVMTRRVAGAEHSPRRLGALVAVLVTVVIATVLAVALAPDGRSEHLADDPLLFDQPVLEIESRVEQNVTKGSTITVPVRSRSVNDIDVTFRYFTASQDANGGATHSQDDDAVQLQTRSLTLQPGEKADVKLSVAADAPAGELGRYGVLQADVAHPGDSDGATKNSAVVMLRYPGDLNVRYALAGAPRTAASTPGVVGVPVRSTSNYALRPRMRITCTPQRGRTVTRTEQASSSVLPGRTVTLLFAVGCTGKAKVTVAPAQAGGTGRRSASLTVAAPPKDGPAAKGSE